MIILIFNYHNLQMPGRRFKGFKGYKIYFNKCEMRGVTIISGIWSSSVSLSNKLKFNLTCIVFFFFEGNLTCIVVSVSVESLLSTY